jgi:hypothetical protein
MSGNFRFCSAPQKNAANFLCFRNSASVCFFVGLGSGGIGGSVRALRTSSGETGLFLMLGIASIPGRHVSLARHKL